MCWVRPLVCLCKPMLFRQMYLREHHFSFIFRKGGPSNRFTKK